MLNPEQEAAVNSNAKTTYVISGPGSGKSTTIIARVQHLVACGMDPLKVWLLTFTSAGAHVFKERLAAAGITVGVSSTLHSSMFRLIQTHGEAIGYKAGRVSLILEEERRDMLEAERRLLAPKLKKGALDPAKKLVLSAGESFDAQLVLRSFARKLKLNNCVDYDGVLTAGRALLDVPEVRAQISIHELLTDETQDSGEEDWSIFDALPADSRFMVADPDQSIFAFRGAHPEIFTARANALGAVVYKLETNYRSGPSICDAANNLIRWNTNRVEKWCVPEEDAPAAHVRAYQFPSEGEEIGTICTWIRYLSDHRKDTSHDYDSEFIPHSEIAVLARTNKLADGYRKALRDAGIPVKTLEFATMPHDWDLCLATVAAMYSPGNDLVASRLLRALKHEPAEIAKWQQDAAIGERPLLIAAGRMPFNPPNLETLPAALVVQEIGRESVALVQSRIDVLPQSDPTLADLVQDLWAHGDWTRQEGEGVTVGTVHSAKAREWQCVVMAGCEAAEWDRGDLEESRRLFYVGITRAKRWLYLTSAATRWKYGKPESCAPSVFLHECGLT